MNHWDRVELLLAEAQRLIEEMQAQNDDEYGLLASAHEHVISARGDIYADTK